MDYFDEDLQGMMGDMYQDETVPSEMPVMEVQAHIKPNAEVNTEVNTQHCVKRVAEDCGNCPFTKKRSLYDRLWDMTKWMGICGGICMLMWWFEMNGLMATEAARPFTFACGGIGCFGAGMNFRK